MALDTRYDSLLAVNHLPINLKQIKKEACVACCHDALTGADRASVLTVQTPLG